MSNKQEKIKDKLTDIPQSETENDPYRDSFLRLFGYSHIIGQTAESVVCRPNFTKLCTGVSLLYCAADVYDKFSKASNDDQNKMGPIKITKTSCKSLQVVVESNPWKPYIAAGDAILWQSLASFMVPAFAVNRITYATQRIVKQLKLDSKMRYVLPPIIGIVSLPFIMRPIDNAVTKLMEFARVQKTDFVNDTYRDTYVRLLGYAYVISKTSYPVLQGQRKLIDLCYGISVLYSFADAIDKCDKAYQLADASKVNKKNHEKINSEKKLPVDYKYQTIITAVDVLIWQSLASFVIPGFLLRNVKTFTKRSLKLAKVPRGRITCMLPPVVALATIPFIIIPIDRIVDEILNQTYRTLF